MGRGSVQTKKDEKGPPEPDGRLSDIIKGLTVTQVNFVVARQDYSRDCDAAESIDISPSTVKNWKYNGVPIDEAVRLMAIHSAAAAVELRKRNLVKAMSVKVAGLDSADEGLRQKVATEIVEWELGKATQKQEVSGQNGGGIVVRFTGNIKPDDV